MEEEELEALMELREFQVRQESRSFDRSYDDLLICECKCLSVGDIREALVTGKKNTVDLNYLRENLGLGSGCSSCLKSFDSWKSKIF